MKTLFSTFRTAILGVIALALVGDSHGQGAFIFSNTGVNAGAKAAVYGPDPDNPNRQQWGNTPGGDPAGMQIYGGATLEGTNYSVEAWSSLNPVLDVSALLPGASAVAGSRTVFLMGIGAGFFAAGTVGPSEWIDKPDELPGYPSGIYLQVRAWDNGGGQYTTWDEAWAAAQEGSGKAVGWSQVFWQPIEFGLKPYPGLINFRSFNVFVVPEPDTSCLLTCAVVLLFLTFRRTDAKHREARPRRGS